MITILTDSITNPGKYEEVHRYNTPERAAHFILSFERLSLKLGDNFNRQIVYIHYDIRITHSNDYKWKG